eukprot:Clim_evm89s134 gene=Clim_evmTU89s134
MVRRSLPPGVQQRIRQLIDQICNHVNYYNADAKVDAQNIMEQAILRSGPQDSRQVDLDNSLVASQNTVESQEAFVNHMGYRILQQQAKPSDEPMMAALALFLAMRRDSTAPSLDNQTTYAGQGITMDQILRGADPNADMYSFFKELQAVVEAGGILAPDDVDRIDRIMYKFSSMSSIYRRYQDVFDSVVAPEAIVTEHSTGDGPSAPRSLLFRFCWVSFLMTKIPLLAGTGDTQAELCLLSANIAWILDHCPRDWLAAERYQETDQLLQAVCQVLGLDDSIVSDAKGLIQRCVEPCMKENGITARLTQDSEQYPLKDRATLRSCLKIVEKEYDDKHRRINEFDEQIFFNPNGVRPNEPNTVQGTPQRYHHGMRQRSGLREGTAASELLNQPTADASSMVSPRDRPSTNGLRNASSTPQIRVNGNASALRSASMGEGGVSPATPMRRLDAQFNQRGAAAMATPLHLRAAQQSVIRGAGAPATPTRKTINSLRQMQESLKENQVEPAQLEQFVDNKEVIEAMVKRVDMLRKVFVEEQVRSISENMRTQAEKRYNMALKMYWRSLYCILEEERSMKHRQKFDAMLSMGMFHRSLIAVCVETVLHCYGSTLAYQPGHQQPGQSSKPWVTEVFKLDVYEFVKIFEPFLTKRSFHISRETIKHIAMIEQEIVTRLAWEQGTALHENLKKTPETMRKYQSVFDIKNLDPVKEEDAATSTNPPAPPEEASKEVSRHTPAQASVRIFYRRLYIIMYHRLRRLSGALGIGENLQRRIWLLFEHAVSHTYSLLQDRHADQILLCCIFGVCRAHDARTEILFKNLVREYKKLPHHNGRMGSVLCQQVNLDGAPTQTEGQEARQTGSIIDFYNYVFLPFLENECRRIARESETDQAKINRDTAYWARGHLSSNPGDGLMVGLVTPVRLRKGLTVSPMRRVGNDMYMSPQRPSASANRVTNTRILGPSGALLNTPNFYAFSHSPSRNLQCINDSVQRRKRPAPEDGEDAHKRGAPFLPTGNAAARKLGFDEGAPAGP